MREASNEAQGTAGHKMIAGDVEGSSGQEKLVGPLMGSHLVVDEAG